MLLNIGYAPAPNEYIIGALASTDSLSLSPATLTENAFASGNLLNQVSGLPASTWTGITSISFRVQTDGLTSGIRLYLENQGSSTAKNQMASLYRMQVYEQSINDTANQSISGNGLLTLPWSPAIEKPGLANDVANALVFQGNSFYAYAHKRYIAVIEGRETAPTTGAPYGGSGGVSWYEGHRGNEQSQSHAGQSGNLPLQPSYNGQFSVAGAQVLRTDGTQEGPINRPYTMEATSGANSLKTVPTGLSQTEGQYGNIWQNVSGVSLALFGATLHFCRVAETGGTLQGPPNGQNAGAHFQVPARLKVALDDASNSGTWGTPVFSRWCPISGINAPGDAKADITPETTLTRYQRNNAVRSLLHATRFDVAPIIIPPNRRFQVGAALGNIQGTTPPGNIGQSHAFTAMPGGNKLSFGEILEHVSAFSERAAIQNAITTLSNGQRFIFHQMLHLAPTPVTTSGAYGTDSQSTTTSQVIRSIQSL